MHKQVRRKNYSKGTKRGDVTRVMLVEGVITTQGTRMLSPSGRGREYQKALHTMEKEGLTSSSYVGCGDKGWRLVEVESRGQEYLMQMPLGYYENYDKFGRERGHSLTRTDTKDIKRVRAIRSSDVSCFMYGAGVHTLFVEDSISIQNFLSSPAYPSFFRTQDLKDYYVSQFVGKVPEGVMSVNNLPATRAFGVLCGHDAFYPVLSTENTMLKLLGSNVEEYFLTLCQKTFSPVYEMSYGIDGILLYKKNEAIQKMASYVFDTDKLSRASFLTARQEIYPRLYVLPYDKKAQAWLPIMTQSDWQSKIVQQIIGDRPKPKTVVACDGIDNEGCHELVFCVPDIMKFVKFAKTAKKTSDASKFRVYCYDWQVSLVSSILSSEEAQIVIVSLIPTGKPVGFRH